MNTNQKPKYKVHKLDINPAKEHDRLGQFLNNLKGEVVSVIPNVETFCFFYGARVKTVVIIEKI